MIWQVQDRKWDLSRRALIMGILNVTPDSFSDGGRFLTKKAALSHARDMFRQGADIVDVGGESTRPGAQAVSAEEEIERVAGVVEAIRREIDVAISIDTSKAPVARAALQAGASIVNDVTGLRGDPEMAAVIAEAQSGVIIMHMQGTPRSMQDQPHYEDVVSEVAAFLEKQTASALASGIEPSRIAIDPGIGFGKTAGHNLELLRQLARLTAGPFPVLVGASRKSFIGRLLQREEIDSRFWPTVALTSYAIEKGARMVRVHDVAPNVQAARMTEAMLGGASVGDLRMEGSRRGAET